MSTVNSLLYRQPLKPRVVIKDRNDGEEIYTFDSFGVKDFNLIYMDCENAVGETGFFNLVIEDSQNIIPRENLENQKVIIELGKQSSEYKYFITGYAQKYNIRNPRSFYQEYLLSGYGSWKRAFELLLQRREVPKDSRAAQLLSDAFSKRTWRPTNDFSIQTITGWSGEGINPDVNIPLGVVNEIYTRFGDYATRISDETGASVFLDYSFGEPERLTLDYNAALHTGINVKTGDQFNTSHTGSNNAYIMEPFELDFDSSTDAGVLSRIYSVTIVEEQEADKQTDDNGQLSTTFKAIAQQFKITLDEKHISKIALKMRMEGEVDSPLDRLNGDIVLDNNNKPTGRVLASFSIPLSDFEDVSRYVEVPEINLKDESKLLSGEIKCWIRVFQRSSNAEVQGQQAGDPNHDEKNTIIWKHNGKFGVAPVDGHLSATANEGDRQDKDDLDWEINTTGPSFCFKIISQIRLLHNRVNPSAVLRFGLVEDIIDSSSLKDITNVTRFLALSLQYLSKTRLNVPEFRVSNPNNFIFRPYQWVNLIHPSYTGDIRVLRSRYVASALSGDRAIGALECFLTLGGQYNTLIANTSCL